MRSMPFVFFGWLALAACSSDSTVSPDGGTPLDDAAPSADATPDTSSEAAPGDASPSEGGTGFVHPGILLDKTQLDFVKAKLAAKAQPWQGAFDTMMASGTGAGGKFSSLTYAPGAVPSVQCVGASGDQNLNIGCQQQVDDAIAAYTDALIYYYGGNTQYADHAISILNAWSSTLQEIKFDTTTYTNGLLQAGWTAEIITRAAEIVRYTYGGWSAGDVQAFSKMLTSIFLPMVNHGWTGGGANWLMSFADATMDIGVFTDDHTTFDLGVSQWHEQVVSALYLTSDVNPYPQLAGYPIPPKGTIYDKSTTTPSTMTTYWHTPGKFVDGLEGETCRDLSHTNMGLDATVDAAETGRIQGLDMFGDEKTRIVAAYEFNAKYGAQMVADLNQSGTSGAVQDGLCGGTMSSGGVGFKLGWEIAYNAYANRLGVAMPYTKTFLDTVTRPGTYKAGLFMAWEELTHAAN